MTSQQRLYSIIQQIPAGYVATYGQVAELAGLPGCARMVGRTLSQLPSDSQLPWHRVIGASGKISLPGKHRVVLYTKKPFSLRRCADERYLY